jgi:hypothetical protein
LEAKHSDALEIQMAFIHKSKHLVGLIFKIEVSVNFYSDQSIACFSTIGCQAAITP